MSLPYVWAPSHWMLSVPDFAGSWDHKLKHYQIHPSNACATPTYPADFLFPSAGRNHKDSQNGSQDTHSRTRLSLG